MGASACGSLEELLSQSDIITLHVPLSPSTRKLIGSPELAMMQRHAILINTCRGPVVDEGALIDALKDGVIAGAGLCAHKQPTVLLLVMHRPILTDCLWLQRCARRGTNGPEQSIAIHGYCNRHPTSRSSIDGADPPRRAVCNGERGAPQRWPPADLGG